MIISSETCLAKADAKIVVIAQRSMSYGFEQAVLVVKGDDWEFSANSNFLEEPTGDAVLGLFRTKTDPVLALEKKELEQISQRLKSEKKSSGKPDHHELIVKFNGRVLRKDSPFYSGLLDMLTRILDIGAWQAVDSMKITYSEQGLTTEKSGGGPSKKRNAKKDSCREDSPLRMRCRIDGYGNVYFTKPKES